MPGQNLRLEYRFASGDLARIPILAAEIVQSKPDVVVAAGAAAATRAMRDAPGSVPLVMFGNFDPLGMLIPHDPNTLRQVDEARAAARSISIDIITAEVAPGSYEGAFASLAASRVEALLVAAHTFFVRDRATIIRLGKAARLPAIYEWPDQVRDGGLMSYGPNLDRLWQRIAVYVDRILKGARAGDLPIELPTTVELAINLRTARAMGLVLPLALVARADALFE